ncbi:hypothetical protein DdX_12942 [Ditylenchus destructor]|uniref:Uncharacterized protein n=1 Tax=Ditylenchus destructor TaxID=166010 RepID=A0AAD4R361_9BILA|nr:hypothetical protein DdX_12942 [Ditylenchus destructor]
MMANTEMLIRYLYTIIPTLILAAVLLIASDCQEAFESQTHCLGEDVQNAQITHTLPVLSALIACILPSQKYQSLTTSKEEACSISLFWEQKTVEGLRKSHHNKQCSRKGNFTTLFHQIDIVVIDIIRGQDTLTCNPVNVTVCESGKVATEAVQKICALDMGNSRIQQIGEDGNVMPDVMPHTMIVEGIRHEAERVLFGILRQLVLSNFNAPAKRYIVPILAFEGEEVNAAHLILECNAGTGLKYKYSSGVIVNFKSGVYAGSYYL